MEDIYFGIEKDPDTNKGKVIILKILDDKGEYIKYSTDIDKLKGIINDMFETHYEFIKKFFYIDKLPKKLNIDLNEYYKIVKSMLAFDYIDHSVFKRQAILQLSSVIKACYQIYKDIFDGNFNFNRYKRIFMEIYINKIK